MEKTQKTKSLVKRTSGRILAVGGSLALGAWRVLEVLNTPFTLVGNGVAWLLSKTVFPAVAWTRNTVPGAGYVIDSLAIVLSINFIVLPAVTLIATASYGLGYAVLASALSIPAYCLLLATSITPWASIALSTLLVAGIWMASEHLAYGIDWLLARPITGEEIVEETALLEAAASSSAQARA